MIHVRILEKMFCLMFCETNSSLLRSCPGYLRDQDCKSSTGQHVLLMLGTLRDEESPADYAHGVRTVLPHVSESTHLATAASTVIDRLQRTLTLLWNFTTSDLCWDSGAAFVCNSRSTFAIKPFALTNAPRTPQSNGSGNARRHVC